MCVETKSMVGNDIRDGKRILFFCFDGEYQKFAKNWMNDIFILFPSNRYFFQDILLSRTQPCMDIYYMYGVQKEMTS